MTSSVVSTAPGTVQSAHRRRAAAPGVSIRPGAAGDAEALAAIYGWHVLNGTGTFEIEPPGAADMLARRDAVLADGWPWLVAEQGGAVVGFAYAGPFRARPAYRFCLENSIYLHPDARRQGIGRVLLAELIARCRALGARQMLAVIGDSANAGSIGLHRALGFAPVGLLVGVGRKFDRWIDVVLMQRALGAGSAADPADTLP